MCRGHLLGHRRFAEGHHHTDFAAEGLFVELERSGAVSIEVQIRIQLHRFFSISQLMMRSQSVARYLSSLSQVPANPSSIKLTPSKKVCCSDSVALIGTIRPVTVVRPRSSVNVDVPSVSSGQFGSNGWRVRLPFSSVNEETNTRRSGAMISR